MVPRCQQSRVRHIINNQLSTMQHGVSCVLSRLWHVPLWAYPPILKAACKAKDVLKKMNNAGLVSNLSARVTAGVQMHIPKFVCMYIHAYMNTHTYQLILQHYSVLLLPQLPIIKAFVNSSFAFAHCNIDVQNRNAWFCCMCARMQVRSAKQQEMCIAISPGQTRYNTWLLVKLTPKGVVFSSVFIVV
ncbi:TPA: hypothetical protein ACH3X1_007125 [Trebouxia sp. C0004]